MTQFNTVNNQRKQSERSGEALLTRRQLLYGALGAGAAAAIGAGVVACGGNGSSGGDVAHLEVPRDAVTQIGDLRVIDDPEQCIQLVSDHELPYGTLVWVDDEAVAACLLPTELGSPLTQIGLLYFASDTVETVLEKAVGAKESFEVYDVRATMDGLIWTEANILEGTWRVYTAPLNQDSLGEPVLLEEGNEAHDTPTLAITADHVFWQVLPKLPNDEGLPCRLMRAPIGRDDSACVFECARRMATPVYANGNSVTIVPRADIAGVYYQLTNIDATSGEVVDQVTLPASMTPLEAGYGPTGFMFSISDIYDIDSGIANLGTYVPYEKPSDGQAYSSTRWFGFTRTPTAAPAWCDDLLVVKSSYSVCGVNLAEGTYFAIDVDDGADTYGDYLASSGARSMFVTFANIDHTPVSGKSTHACIVKRWQPLPPGSAPAKTDDDGTDASAIDGDAPVTEA